MLTNPFKLRHTLSPLWEMDKTLHFFSYQRTVGHSLPVQAKIPVNAFILNPFFKQLLVFTLHALTRSGEWLYITGEVCSL